MSKTRVTAARKDLVSRLNEEIIKGAKPPKENSSSLWICLLKVLAQHSQGWTSRFAVSMSKLQNPQ